MKNKNKKNNPVTSLVSSGHGTEAARLLKEVIPLLERSVHVYEFEICSTPDGFEDWIAEMEVHFPELLTDSLRKM